ncbi:MAG: class I SAM-dependent methyltransferase, partial [Nitrospiria bacterium]
MTKGGTIRRAIKNAAIRALPLPVRKGLCIAINRQARLGPDVRWWWTQELLRDYREADVVAYHQFLWSHHLGYALPYENRVRFGRHNMVPSRALFFEDLNRELLKMGVNPSKDVRSVLEVGCSLGYQLRYCETDLFPSAVRLDGIDIDGYAIERGMEYLRKEGSRVRIWLRDTRELGELLRETHYDVILCTGVLMYLDQRAATEAVLTMVRHGNVLTALSGLAHPEMDNRSMRASVSRDSDAAFIHNMDQMVEVSNGVVLGRRWGGEKTVG